jgi:hypothetical protein
MTFAQAASTVRSIRKSGDSWGAPYGSADDRMSSSDVERYMGRRCLDAADDLGTPPLRAGTEEVWAWRKALFDIHFEAARGALQRTG